MQKVGFVLGPTIVNWICLEAQVVKTTLNAIGRTLQFLGDGVNGGSLLVSTYIVLAGGLQKTVRGMAELCPKERGEVHRIFDAVECVWTEFLLSIGNK